MAILSDMAKQSAERNGYESSAAFGERSSEAHVSRAGILALAPRGLSRVQAAAYIGVSPSLFDELVKDGRMPRPKRINSRTVWDRIRLDEAFEAILDDESRAANPWDEEEL